MNRPPQVHPAARRAFLSAKIHLPLRAAFPGDGVEAAASAWNGKCVARFMGSDAALLRRALVRAITTLRGGPLPRVWQI